MNEKTDKKSAWENFLEFFRSWTNTATEKAGEITRSAATKAEEWSKVGRLKVDIYQLQREQSRMFTDLGRIAFDILEGKKTGPLETNSSAVDLRKRIDAITAEINRKEKEIEEAAKDEEAAAEKQATPKAKPTGGTPEKTASEKKPAAPKASSPKPATKRAAPASKKASPAGAKKSTGSAKAKASPASSKAAPKKKSGSTASKGT